MGHPLGHENLVATLATPSFRVVLEWHHPQARFDRDVNWFTRRAAPAVGSAGRRLRTRATELFLGQEPVQHPRPTSPLAPFSLPQPAVCTNKHGTVLSLDRVNGFVVLLHEYTVRVEKNRKKGRDSEVVTELRKSAD
ncbi:hypothetical protein V6N13_040745 [Hibiscus sabdariffa]